MVVKKTTATASNSATIKMIQMKAPSMLKPLEDRIFKLEQILEFLVCDVKGERGELLRKRFYEQK